MKHNYRTIFNAALPFAVLLFVVGCTVHSTNHEPNAFITPSEGGELRSRGSDVFRLNVPPGAVDEEVRMTFGEYGSNDSIDGVPNIETLRFRLEPDGLQFNVPASVTIKIPLEQGAESVSPFDLYSVSSDGEVTPLDNVENSVDLAAGEITITGDLSHFSSIVRSKRQLTASLEQIDPRERQVGQSFSVRGGAGEDGSSFGYAVDWQMQGDSKVRLDRVTPSYGPEEPMDLGLSYQTVKNPDGSIGSHVPALLDESFFNVNAEFTCTAAGTGIYTFNVSGTQRGGFSETARPSRPVRMSMSGTVHCVVPPAVQTATSVATVPTATSSLDQTPTALTPPTTTVPTSTPSMHPTPTALPDVARGDERLRLVFVASTGSGAPGTGGERFSTFETPSTGGGFTYFYGFTESGTTGIWVFEEDDLAGALLEPVVVSVAPYDTGELAYIDPGAVSVTQTGLAAIIARLKTDTGFEDFISIYDGKTGGSIDIVHEGDLAPGREGEVEFSQFYSASVAESSIAAYRAFADGEGFWVWTGEGGSLPLVFEGQALEGLEAGWRLTGSGGMQIASFTDVGTGFFYINDFRTNSGETGSGLWLVSSAVSVQIVRSGMAAPDFTTFTNIGAPSSNSTGEVAFMAEAQFDQLGTSFLNRAIWKHDVANGLVKVAESGMRVDSLGVELADVSQPLMLEDGRVVFVAQVFDSSNSLINFVLVESGDGFEVLARTDALPGPGGAVSEVPFQIRQFSVNRSGHVVFELGIGDSVWMQSPGGHLHRVAGRGDTLDVPAPSGTAQKTVAFVEYLGGANTGSGRPTGYSDEHRLSLKVTFDDGTESLVMATFDEPPLVQ